MILTEDYLQDLLDKTLPQVRSGDWAVVLEGSIAEGFGNSGSDIDFLLIGRSEDDLPTMPSLFFVDGRRVEVRTRSLRQVTEQFTALKADERRVGRISEDLLNRCQRLLHSFPLRGHALVDEVKAQFPQERFRTVAADWWAHAARQSLRHAMAMLCLGEDEEAVDWARSGLVQAVKSWAAVRGETYLEPKWLSMQLDRAQRPGVRERYWELESGGTGMDADARVDACLAFAAELGVTGVPHRPERLAVERRPGVTTWQVVERVHVVRGRSDVFAFGERAGRVWRSLVLGRPLPEALAGARAAGGSEAGPLLAQFLRLGLVRLTWKGGGTVTPALPLASPPGPLTPPPSTVRPLLSLRGAAVSGPDAVDLVPLPAARFSAAALALVFSNMVVENAREDLAGAVRRNQWRVAEVAAHRAAQSALRGLFCAYGVSPLPPDPDLVRRLPLLSLPPDTRPIGPLADALIRVAVDSAESAERVSLELEEFIGVVREAAGADAFPASFDSPDTWRATLELGHDWVRVAAHFDADLPLEEVRDLVASSGAQPHQAG
ncbi:hypothetical protein ACWZEH_27730 [Streptomyces sp. QTS137]